MPLSSIQRYLRHGTLPQLRLFEASARLGSHTRAALELHMSQPAASVQIKKLSQTLGVALFEQVGKRIYLTDAGRELEQRCHELFQVFNTLETSLAGLRALDAGRLQLAVSTSATCFAPRLLGAFAALHPGVQTSIHAFNRRALAARLRQNEDDLYLFADAPRLGAVVAQALLPNPLVVLARDDHALTAQRGITLSQLAREPFIVREEGSGTRRTMLALFRRQGLKPSIRMTLGTNEAIKEAVLAGLGVAVMPRHSFGLDPESSRLRCLDVAGFPLENHWVLAYPEGKQLSAVTQAFLDYARGHAKGLMLESLQRELDDTAVPAVPAVRAVQASAEAMAKSRPGAAAKSAWV